MFIAAMPTIAKRWKEPRCPLTDIWIKKMWYICTHDGILLSHQKNEILPLAMMWMELEGIILSEISQSEKANYMISLMWNLNKTEDHRGREGKIK